MGMPKQVQRQADAAAEYDKQLASNTAKPDEPVPPPADPVAPVEQAPEPVVPAPVASDDDPEKWKQRYLSLQGIFQSQKTQIGELTTTIQNLTVAMEQMKASPAPAAAAPAGNTLVTEQDVEAFGADLVDLSRRIAREQFGEREDGYKAEIAKLRQKLEQTDGYVAQVASSQAVSKEEKFFDSLAKRMSNWEQIQATPECQAWLDTKVPGSRSKWDEILKDAASRMNVDDVIEVFDAFIKSAPQFGQQPAPKGPTAAQSKAADELNKQVAPTRSQASSSTPNGSRRTYTSAQYQSESMRVVRLAQTGQHDAAAALEKELDTALVEGRITP